VNRYRLNPKPRLIFGVEGQGEADQVPLIYGEYISPSSAPPGVP
jgi:hypothetical protein